VSVHLTTGRPRGLTGDNYRRNKFATRFVGHIVRFRNDPYKCALDGVMIRDRDVIFVNIFSYAQNDISIKHIFSPGSNAIISNYRSRWPAIKQQRLSNVLPRVL